MKDATNYAEAVRRGSLHAARTHQRLGERERIERVGGNVDVFQAMVSDGLPLLLRPLHGLLGAFLSDPIPGALVTTQRSLSIQRFTAAHEFGHFSLHHTPSLDDESILRRMSPKSHELDLKEVEADAFAVGFLMPRWLVSWHCRQQGWTSRHLENPHIAYQLALRLGASYEATTWTLERYNFLQSHAGRALREVQPRSLKVDLLRDYRPSDYRGDVWVLSEKDAGTQIEGSRHDQFVLHLDERPSGGYLWNIDRLAASGFVILRDRRESVDSDGVGSPVTREVTATPQGPQRGQISLAMQRAWQPGSSVGQITLDYDFTGPEEQGLSRAERRQLLQAA